MNDASKIKENAAGWGDMQGERKKLSEATCGAPYGHMAGRDFLDVRVTVWRRCGHFIVVVNETRGHDEVYGRCEVVGDSARLDAAFADAVVRARKAEIEIRCLTPAVAEAHNAAIDVLLQEQKNGASDA